MNNTFGAVKSWFRNVYVSAGSTHHDPHRIVPLDGVRALAVLAVFLQHSLGMPLWMGVDLFFVMSGFLITGILLDRKSKNQSYFAYFYARRARRILPPYVLLLIVSSCLFGVQWFSHWPWFAFFATNIGESLGSIGHPSLNPLWSLAVEEQFYLLWPFVVLYTSEKTLGFIAAGLIVVAPVLRACATPFLTSFWPVYYLTPFRMDLLGMGALLAVSVRRNRDVFAKLVPAAIAGALVAIITLLYLHVKNPHFRATNTPFSNATLYSISLVFCTALIVIAIESKGLIRTAICHPFLVYIGTISYTIYLIHLTALYLVWQLSFGRLLSAVVGFVITFVYASISWFAVERNLIGRGRKIPAKN